MPTTYLAFDYGTKRVGLAVGNDITKTAQALPPISTTQYHNAIALSTIIKEWRIAHLIFGAPLNQHGEATKTSQKVKLLGDQLGKQLNLPVSHVDERYTSVEANRILRQQGRQGKSSQAKNIAMRDSIAAQLILETYLSHL